MRLDLGKHLGLDLGAEVHQGLRAELGIGEVSQRLVLGRLGLCGGGRTGPFELRGCATGYGGALWVDGHGYEVDAKAREPWLAVGLGLRLRAPLGRRFAFFTSIDGIVPLTRIEPEIVDSGGSDDRLVQTASPVGGRLSAGLSIQFD